MNLSARLRTAANMGELDDPKRRYNLYKIILGNLAFQVQATMVASVAASVVVLLSQILLHLHPQRMQGSMIRFTSP
jgi:solute carrier family 41